MEESMTLNLEAIQSQKIALGFVEVPACERLRALAAQVPADQAIVELGAYKGRSTGWLALGASEGNGARIVSIDCWDLRPAEDWPAGSPAYTQAYSDPATEAAYQAHLDLTGIRPQVTTVKGFGLDFAKDWKSEGLPKVGLLWHDAAHHYDEVLADLKAWIPLMANDAVIVLHDAGNPNYGVVSAAEAAFKSRKRWDWAGRQIDLWPKQPTKRGTLTVRTKA
jgi:hypothetical protein